MFRVFYLPKHFLNIRTGYRNLYDTSNAKSIQDCNQIIAQTTGWQRHGFSYIDPKFAGQIHGGALPKIYSDCVMRNFKLNEQKINQLTRTMLQMQKGDLYIVTK